MARAMKIMVYSDNVDTRQQIMLALGRRPSRELPEVEYVEVATEPMVIRTADAGGLDLLILDGEAAPAGGMGVCRQLKDELYKGPPILVVVARPQDAWLATWSKADAVVSHPLDPMAFARAVAELLLPRVANSVTS
jgi:DNA-binding response OmpR family regulator